jgi:hypothetical protein
MLPHGLSYEGDVREAQRLLGLARQEMDRLRARLETTGLDSGKFLLGVPGTSNYVYGHILPGGAERIHIVTTPGVAATEPLEEEDLALPDFLSGYTIDGRMEADPETDRMAVRDFRPTAACAALHSDEVHTGANRVERLALDVGPGFSDYFPDRGPLPRSQSDLLYPTAYSGSMRKLVQLMHGFGKKPTQTSIYDDIEPEILPDEEHIETAWERTLVDEGMRIWYDFRFSRTHGITFASDGKPWLVEISMNRGVVAMPLPIDYRTTTEDFRLKLENLGDEAGIKALDDFGGFPSGEPFPSTGALWDAYVRAGRIITLAEPAAVAEFYQHLHYSSAMGWAFSEDGGEAHNTAYTYGDDGVQIGVHWAVQMQIGASDEIDPPDNAIDLNNDLNEMASHGTFDAVMWKIDRLSESEIEGYLLRLNSERTEDVYDDIDAIELDGLASGSASAKEASHGFLYWPSRYQPQIKFYEPQLGYLLSHDLRPDISTAEAPDICDTTVHVFFVGNELKWAKFFRDIRTTQSGFGGDDQFIAQYTPQGSFYRYWSETGLGVPTQFYTNDIDIRAEVGGRQIDYYYNGTSRGFRQYHFTIDHWTEPPVGFDGGSVLWCRNKLFFKELTTVHDIHRSQSCAICVPAWFRESMFVATMTDYFDRGTTHSWHWQGVTDPNYGYDRSGDGDTLVELLPYSHFDEVNEVYALTKPFADEGQWCNIGDEIEFSGSMPSSTEGETTNVRDPYRIKVFEVTLIANSPQSPKVVKTETREGDPDLGSISLWEPLYFLPSPDPDDGSTQYHHATANSYGDSDCLIYLNDINGTENVAVGSPEDSAFVERLPVFVGVV